MKVRKLTSGDDPQQAIALLQRFFREEEFTTPNETVAANLRRMLELDICAVLLAEEHDAAIGVATVSMEFGIEYGWSAEMGDLYVRPESRKSGAARALVRAVEEWLIGKGARGYQVTLAPHGAAAGLRRFYDAMGFEDEGRLLLFRTLGEQ